MFFVIKKNELQKNICRVVDSLRQDHSTIPVFKNIWCDLSYLICSSFNENNWNKFLNSTDYCNKPELCTDIGKKLSSSLIKIASTRIFSNPEQSILELPVNSLDAYGEGSNVGKFGMGFFSILYWLIDHPERKIVIDSCYINEYGILEKFTCYIKYNGKLMFKLSNESSRNSTGSTISVDCSKDKFTSINLEQFAKQLNKLEYTSSSGIYVKTESDDGFKLFNKCQSCDNKVFILYESNGIQVTDDASGIPLKVLLLKLFTPSISTKTIKLSEQKQVVFNNESKCFLSEENHFIILVNKVAIVDITFNNDDINKYSIIIDLPPNTRVPVSRDDIIFDGETIIKLYESIIMVSNISVEQFNSLYALDSAIKAYDMYTVNQKNRIEFNKIWLYVKNYFNEVAIFIEYKYEYLFNQIKLSKPYIIINRTNLTLLQKHLETEITFSKDVFIAKNVVFLNKVDQYCTSAGTSSFLFIEYSYTSKGDNWPMQLSLTNLTDTLIPKAYVSKADTTGFSILNDSDNKEFMSSLFEFVPADTKYRNLLNIFGLKFLSLLSRYTIKYINYVSYFTETAALIYNCFGYDNSELFLNLYMERFELLRPTLSYSEGKPSLYVFYSSIAFNDNNLKTGYDIYKNFPPSLKIKQLSMEWVDYSTKLDTKGHVFLSSNAFLPIKIVYIYIEQSGFESKIQVNKYIQNLNKRKITLYKSSLKISFIMGLMVDICENSFEFNLIYQMLQYLEYQNEIKISEDYISEIFNLTNEEIKILGEFVIEITKLTYNNVKSLYPEPITFDTVNDLKNSYNYSFIINKRVLNTLSTPTIIKINEITHKENLPIADISVFNKNYQYKFNESQLIDTSLTNNFSTLQELFHLSSINQTKNKLQITEIAINEGSTKSITNSVVTETVQNSLDAIRTFNPSNKNIDIEISTSGNNVIFSITDYVGINKKGIIATMIPFLSSKTPSEIVTGEMGSGFFNIYRESKKVLIETLNDNTKTTILDTSIYDGNRVIDIDREVSILNVENTSGNKTTIYAWYEINDPVKRTDIISNFLNMTKFTIGLIQGVKINLNGKNIQIPLEIINTTDNFEFKIKQNQDINVNSYIFTKGVPFSPLYEYFKDKNVIPEFLLTKISSNCVLNIKHGVFTPVQTRGSLNISNENLILLKSFMYDSVYIAMLKYLSTTEINKTFNELISNFTSKASLGQLLFSTSLHPLNSNSIKIFMVNYQYDGNKPISVLIQGCEKIMQTSEFYLKKPALNRYLDEQTDNILIKDVVLKWLSNKNQINTKNDKLSTDIDGKQEEDKNKLFLESFFNKFINIYWTNGRSLGIPGFETDIPKCEIKSITENTVGYYKPSSHSLVLNLNWMKNSNDFVTKVNSKNLLFISRTDIFIQFLALSLPSSTLIHELEHARRNSNHNTEGSHDSLKESFLGEEPKIYTFEESSNKVYDLIVRNTELYTQLLN